jgi:hypothetical protein
MMSISDKENDVKKYGISAQGRKEYLKILKGEHASYKERCLAMCYECMGYYVDGRETCTDVTCPLYMIMPYRKIPPEDKK